MHQNKDVHVSTSPSCIFCMSARKFIKRQSTALLAVINNSPRQNYHGACVVLKPELGPLPEPRTSIICLLSCSFSRLPTAPEHATLQALSWAEDALLALAQNHLGWKSEITCLTHPCPRSLPSVPWLERPCGARQHTVLQSERWPQDCSH